MGAALNEEGRSHIQEDLTPLEKRLIQMTLQGEKFILDEALPANDRLLRAAMLRRLILGTLRLPEQIGITQLAPGGIRLRGAIIEGTLDLSDGREPQGSPLPPILLENCTFTGAITLSHAVLGRISLRGSRFATFLADGCVIRGGIDLANVGPLNWTPASPTAVSDAAHVLNRQIGECWVRMRGCEIDGDITLDDSHFELPEALRQKRDLNARSEYAVDFSGARIHGRINAQRICANGGLSLRAGELDGQVWLTHSYLEAQQGSALSLQDARIGSGVYLSSAEDPQDSTNRRQLHAYGLIDCSNSEIAGTFSISFVRLQGKVKTGEKNIVCLDCNGARIDGDMLMAKVVAEKGRIDFQGARISGSLLASGMSITPDERIPIEEAPRVAIRLTQTKVEGQVDLSGLDAEGAVMADGVETGGRLSLRDAKLQLRTFSGAAPHNAVVMEIARIRGILDFSGAHTKGAIVLARAEVGGGLRLWDVNLEATLRHYPQADRAFAEWMHRGCAIYAPGLVAAGTVRIEDTRTAERDKDPTQVVESTKTFIYGKVVLRGCRFDRELELNVAKNSPTIWELADGACLSLKDNFGEGWGEGDLRGALDVRTRARLDLTGFRYSQIQFGGHKESGWASFVGRTEQKWAEKRIDWIERYCEDKTNYIPLVYTQLASALRDMGHDEAARKVLVRKLWRSTWRAKGLFSRLVHIPYGCFFGFGYSPGRAVLTCIMLFAIGLLTFSSLNRAGAMVIDQQAVATAARPVGDSATAQFELGAPADASVVSGVPCGQSIEPALYTLDVMVPLIDLRQEAKCEVGQKAEFVIAPFSADDSRAPKLEVPVWVGRTFKSAFAILGWIVVSLSILTFSGVLQRRSD
jgi:uncharacterized protein YjbI with pentapeptide repeats